MLYVNNNGTVLSADAPSIYSNSRAFLYGDGVFESIRIRNGKPLNLENHVKRLIEGAKAIKIRPSSYLSVEFFQSKIEELCHKSGVTEGGKCRISLDRLAGGTYKPESNELHYFIDVLPLAQNEFLLNSKGFEVDIYMDMKKHKNFLSNFKVKNGLIYIMAAIKAQERNLDDLLISNDNGGILESSSSNLFVVSNGVLYTPGLEEGCLAGTMRMQIINLALKEGIKVYECNILPSNLLAADEAFLTNAINGITWISGYRTKRYFNNNSKRLIGLLNAHWSAIEEELGVDE